jgi:hypothetical protein
MSSFWTGFVKQAEVSKKELIHTLKKHEERETPAQEAAESEEEQRIERAAGVHEKQARVLKSVMSGLLGVGEFTPEVLARQAGRGVRRSLAPVGAAGGTAILMDNRDKKKAASADTEKKAFWQGFSEKVDRA